MRRAALRCCIAIAIATASLAYADSPIPTGAEPASGGAGDSLSAEPSSFRPRLGIALAEIEGNNIIVNVFDAYIIPAVTGLPGDWAQTNLATSWANIEGPWRFDEDPFPVNEIVHPFEGGLYFVSGRSNGLGFWGSAAGTAFGALM